MQFEPKVAAQHATLMGYWCFVSLLLTVLTRPCPRGSSQNLGGAGSPLRFSTVTPVPALVTCRPREDFNLSGCVHNYVLVLFPALIQDLQHLVKLRRKEVERSDDGAVWSKLILLHDFLVVHSVLRNVREGIRWFCYEEKRTSATLRSSKHFCTESLLEQRWKEGNGGRKRRK